MASASRGGLPTSHPISQSDLEGRLHHPLHRNQNHQRVKSKCIQGLTRNHSYMGAWGASTEESRVLRDYGATTHTSSRQLKSHSRDHQDDREIMEKNHRLGSQPVWAQIHMPPLNS